MEVLIEWILEVVSCRHGLLHFLERLCETTLAVQHHSNDGDDAAQHDDALNEVVDGCSLVAAQNHIDSRKQCHDDDTVLIRDAETHVEEFRDTAIHTCCIGNEEYESNDGSRNAQSLITETCAEEVWHGARLDMLSHQFCTTTQDEPCQKRTDNGIADTNPRTGKTILPAELTCITDKYDC